VERKVFLFNYSLGNLLLTLLDSQKVKIGLVNVKWTKNIFVLRAVINCPALLFIPFTINGGS
jgi:hypothetical protein